MKTPETHPKLAVFLGSGASMFAGYRTFASFPDLIFNKTLRTQEGMPPLHDSTPDLLNEVKTVIEMEGHATTHDRFLWKLEGYKSIWNSMRHDGPLSERFLRSTNLRGDFSHFGQIVEDAITDISRVTVRHYSVDRVKKAKREGTAEFELMRRAHALYLKLGMFNNHASPYLPIFTTNYDMLLEDLVAEFDSGTNGEPSLVNGIGNGQTEGVTWDSSEFATKNSPPRGIHLYRLHGCVCWYFHGLGNEGVFFHRRDCVAQPENNLCAMYPGKEIYRGKDPHATGFRNLQRVLCRCSLIVFIGFSFRDDDVMHLILTENAHRKVPIKIIVVNPSLHAKAVRIALGESSAKTPYSVRLPAESEIEAISARFGYDEFDTRILETINQTLRETL